MLYIIGGTSRAGKSTIARSLSLKHGISLIPFDVMMSSLIEINNPLSINYMADSDIIAEQMWPFTKSMIKNLLAKEETNFILEGISFWPDLLNEIYNRKVMKACFIGYTEISTEEKLNQLRKNSENPHSWQNEFSDDELSKQIKNIKRISSRLKGICKLNMFKYFESNKPINAIEKEIEIHFDL